MTTSRKSIEVGRAAAEFVFTPQADAAVGCLDGAVYGVSSWRMILPPFMTNRTRWNSPMSACGSPETATRSANLPFSIEPI
jgi:hypothetical protein